MSIRFVSSHLKSAYGYLSTYIEIHIVYGLLLWIVQNEMLYYLNVLILTTGSVHLYNVLTVYSLKFKYVNNDREKELLLCFWIYTWEEIIIVI